jgi:hypothetical protein
MVRIRASIAVGGFLLNMDRQHQVEATARLVARHLTLGHPPELIISALARALLREDAGFHAYQILEAGVRQFTEWGNTEPGRHILIAVARYLAAHSPTGVRGSKPPISQPACHGATGFMRMPDDQISRLRLPLWTSIDKAEPSP